MNVDQEIDSYITGQPEPKQGDLLTLHRLVLEAMPGCRLWFMDGKDADGKVVSNPNIGYGVRTLRYANGETREFYRIGLSANSTGVSVYILGLEDKTYLPRTYARSLGKAKVTGYCIKFKKLADIDLTVLEAALRDGVNAPGDD